MGTYNSGTNEFARVKECVRIGVIRRLDGPLVNDIELETLHREIRTLANDLLANQPAHGVSGSEQQRLLNEVSDEICAAGIRGLSESLWDQPSDLQYRVFRAAIPTLFGALVAVGICPLDLRFSVFTTALVSCLTLTVFTALLLLCRDSSIRPTTRRN